MATNVAALRRFDVSHDAQRFVKLTDGDSLYEVMGTRGILGRSTADGEPAVRLLDCRRDLPDDPFEAIDAAPWVPAEEVGALGVVVPAPDGEVPDHVGKFERVAA